MGVVAEGTLAERLRAVGDRRYHDKWVDRSGLAYFEDRLTLAKHDADIALRWVLEAATTPKIEDACVAALSFKCDVLWSMLDATAIACGVYEA